MLRLALALFLGVSVLALNSFDQVTENMKRFREFKVEGKFTAGPGEFEYSIQRPEGARKFWAYAPPSYDGSTPYPLVFAFHGLGDNCHSFGHNTGMVDQADMHNFILVYPCGFNGILGTAWNAGTCCLEGYNIDDVAFTRNMVTYMSSNYNIDKTRLYTTGFSNGAFMTERLLCEASDLFVAGASVSGVVVLLPGNSGGLTACDQKYSANNYSSTLLHIHGNLDVVVPWTGDALLGFPEVPTDFSRWAQRVGCMGAPVNTFTNGPYSNQIYQNCNDGTQMQLVKHELGLHAWPSDKYFDTATYICQFILPFNRTSSN